MHSDKICRCIGFKKGNLRFKGSFNQNTCGEVTFKSYDELIPQQLQLVFTMHIFINFKKW